MTAHALKMEEFLRQMKTRFVIPVYQRNYDWTPGQCTQLMNDILKAGADDGGVHFIGSIVYIHDNIYTSANTKELVIIDGQQRLTTLTLIYVALYRLAKQMGNDGLSDEINEIYLINKFPAAELKLKLTENNDKSLRFLWNNDSMAEYPEFSKVIENFNYINGRINQENYQRILKGLSKLLFVEISLERGKDDPQRIFESLNSTGLELSQADLIRNYILMGLDYDEQQRIYKNYWDFIEKHAFCTLSNESRVSDFIRDYLTLENKRIPNKENVYTEFKIKYPSFNDLDSTLTTIKRFVKHYNKLINPESEPDKEIREELKSINRLESTVAHPFLLQIYDDYANRDIEKALFIEILKLIQSFVWRRFITGLPTNALNKIFMNLYEKIDKTDCLYSIQCALVQRSGSQRFPNNEEVINALHFKDMYNIKSRNIQYVLEKLENYNNTEKVIIQDNADITIEHIFPQKPDKIWEDTLDKEEYALIKEKYLHTIGNLTLSGNNGKLGNKSFQEKKCLKDAGYKDSRLWLNKYLASIDAWNIKALEQRFSIITERFLEIWPYPPIRHDAFSTEVEVTILEAGDPTGKTLEYVIFRDEKKRISTVTELYREVVKQLFESQPDRFFTTSLADTIYLTRKEDKDKLRHPLEVTDTWFIEGNMDNKTKFRKIKQIASVFDLEDDIIIKYTAL
jgi:uncharacterized protein with ParB-like and HNH nuclease domain